MEEKRRAPRRAAGWDGLCLIEDEVAGVGWRAGTVLDISMFGLAVSICDGDASGLVGRRIAVEIPPISDSVTVRLDGEIKNAWAVGATVRLGIELAGLSPVEEAITCVLGALTDDLELAGRVQARCQADDGPPSPPIPLG